MAFKDGIVNAGSLRGAMMSLVREAPRHRIEAELSWLVEARNAILGLMAS